MLDSDLWILAKETAFAFSPTYDMAMRAVVKDVGLQHTWFPLYVARGLHPAPLTLQTLMKVRPNCTREQQQAALDALVDQGYLAPRDAAYALTPTGSKAIERVFRIVHRELGKVKALPSPEMQRLAEHLRFAVYHALHAPQPTDKIALRFSRWTDTGDYSPPAISIEQYLTDLIRFRLDCSRQARAGCEVTGPTWDMFTRIADGSAPNLQALRKALAHRRHPPEVFSQVIQSLIRRGWIEEGSGRGSYCLTDAGRSIYTEVEAETAALFDPIWAHFTPAERADLVKLLARLNEHLASKSRRGRLARQA